MNPAPSHPRRGAVLILVVGLIAILAVIATTFLARSRGDAATGEDATRLAQTRLMLHAALSHLREASRLGYATVNGDLETLDPREAWGWIDTRMVVPGAGNRIGPNATDGTPLWSATGLWPGPGGVLRAPMYRMRRPPFAVTPEVVRNPIPSDPNLATFGIPFLTNPDPVPLLPDGSYFDIDDPRGGSTSSVPPSSPPALGNSAARKAWAEGDRIPVAGSADLAWFRIYRERIVLDAAGEPVHVAAERTANAIPDNAGVCTFIVTVGAGGSRGYRDWGEVPAGDRASFGNSQTLFEELMRSEQRQWFRVAWSAAVGGGEDLIIRTAYYKKSGWQDLYPVDSQYERPPLNASRWEVHEFPAPSHPRNYGGTIAYIQRLAGPPATW